MPTFSGAPQTPDVGRASTVAPLTPAPAQSSLGNPWAATRERMSSVTLQVEGACPTSAGLSETSTPPVQRSMGVQSVGAGSVISAQACPMTGVGGSYPYYQPPSGQGVATGQGQAHHRHQDEIRKDRLPIPKLQVQGGDPTMVTRQINDSAALLWGQVVQIARQQHHNWLSLNPAQRASQLGLPTTGYVLPLQLPVLEATMRAELLTQVLPGKVTSLATQKGTTTVLDLLFMTFQTSLPSEPSARVDGLATIEAPLKPARTFSDALTTLRTWRQQVLTVVTDLGGNPEPLQLFTSLKTLISSLISSDTAFSTEVSHMYRQTNIKTLCTDTNLLQLMGLLEIELSARAQEDDEERRRKGHANSSSAMANAAGGKGHGKGNTSAGKGKGGQSKGGKASGKDSKPVCTDYLSDNGLH